MIKRLCPLKVNITVDIDVSFEFEKKISDIFDTIVDTLYSTIGKKYYKDYFKICANRIRYDSINIYKFKHDNIESFTELVKETLDNLTKIEYTDNGAKEPEIVYVDYLVEFNNSNNYFIY